MNAPAISKNREVWQGRWGWWYPAIADWMIANPSGKLYECAKELGKSPNTISAITQTDLFKAYLEKRRAEWQERHDLGLRQKMHAVAELGLDIMLETLEKKRDIVPLARTTEITMSALDRLGYSPNRPGPTNVQVNTNGQTQVVIPAVSVGMLEEARQAIRTLEAKKQSEPLSPSSLVALSGSGAEPYSCSEESEDEDAPLTISAE